MDNMQDDLNHNYTLNETQNYLHSNFLEEMECKNETKKLINNVENQENFQSVKNMCNSTQNFESIEFCNNQSIAKDKELCNFEMIEESMNKARFRGISDSVAAFLICPSYPLEQIRSLGAASLICVTHSPTVNVGGSSSYLESPLTRLEKDTFVKAEHDTYHCGGYGLRVER